MTGQAARATYRLQMHAGFTFADAAAVTAYLGRLGVSHLYLSPILQAAPGSTHGYDVVDPTRVNRELGGDDGYRRLQDAAAASGLGQLLDVVPNHMAITGRDNAWWWDVLENGPASPYASYFDVDWDPPESKLRNLVLLPILGDHYGRELEAGRLQVEREGGAFVLHYYGHLAPLAPRSLDELLAAAARRLPEDVEGSPEASVRQELESLATAFGRLPISTLTDTSSVRERHRDKDILRGRLADLCEQDGRVAGALDAEVEALNGDVDRLDTLLDRQNYRLAWWRIAGEELDYRRFFDINGLAGIRVEDPEVFADSHRLILEWLTDGVIDGVRIDHVDGLRDPHTYLGRLSAAAPEAWVLVEKILEGDERMPEDWPVAGTTGYDWLNAVAGVLTDAEGAGRLTDAYRDWTGLDARFEQVVLTCKQAVLEGSLAADVSRLVARLALICEGNRRYRDYTRRDLRDCLAEVLVAFAVYRTYVQVGVAPSGTDRATVEAAVLTAGVRRPDLDEELLGLVRDLLLLRVPGAQAAGLALRFQQVSGPVMAKAVEDTAFYRYLPCSWLNEVGADPGRPGATVEAFHTRNHDTQERYPQTLLATSSHDTKRSEDVRARLSVLAEMAEGWISVVTEWHGHHETRRQAPAPDRNTEWLFYQSLVGAWPIDADRILAYLVKATREAKVHTSWTDPDPVYDESLRVWLGEAMADPEFLGSVDAFVGRIRRLGWRVGLAQKLLTLTAPGVPDLYQGSECWDLSL
ncbi:MAG: malto-oligosyltrehalose synthase, partial [Acidimicrobiales bacterium]